MKSSAIRRPPRVLPSSTAHFVPLDEIAQQSGRSRMALRRSFIPVWLDQGLAMENAYGQWHVDPAVIDSIEKENPEPRVSLMGTENFFKKGAGASRLVAPVPVSVIRDLPGQWWGAAVRLLRALWRLLRRLGRIIRRSADRGMTDDDGGPSWP
jgi:hypothetical protein